MDLKTILIIVLGVSILAWFTPTPIELEGRFKSGQDFYAARDYRRAIEQYELIIGAESRLLIEDSVRVSLLNNELIVGVRTASIYQKGNAFRMLGQKDSALSMYRVAVGRTDSPRLSALAQYQIYEIYYADKDHTNAIKEARALISDHPTNEKVPQAYYDIGWSFRELGQLDSSANSFEELIRRFPESELDPKARYQVAEIYFGQKHWDQAIEEFRELITKYRPESFARSEWENVELKALRDRKLFEAVSSKDVDLTTLELTAKAQVRIGDTFRARGTYDSAMANYRKVTTTFSLMPSLVEATYIKMAEYTTERLGIDDGIAIYREAIDNNFSNKPLQAKFQYKIARTFQEQKLYAKAAHEYMFYAQACGAEAEGIQFPVEQAYFLAVSNYFNARDYGNTIRTVDTCLRIAPGTELAPKLHLYRGLSESAQLRYADARRSYQQVIAANPTSNEAVIAHAQLGKSHLDEKNYAEAIRSFDILMAGDHSRLDTSEVHYFLGLSHYGLNAFPEAIRHLEHVDPTSTYYPFTFARITRAAVQQKDFAGAAAYLDRAEQAARLDTIVSLPFIRLARAELFSAQQLYPAAVAQFDSVITDTTLTENTRMQALYGRGLLHSEMTKHQEAANDLRACVNSAVFVQVFPALVSQAKEKLAFSLVSLGRRKEGADIINGLVKNASSDQERGRYLATLTELYFRATDYPLTVETGSRVFALAQADEQALVRTYVTMGNCYGNQQQHAKAISTLTEAADRFPSNAFLEETFFHLGLLYYNGSDYVHAEAVLGSFRTRYPGSTTLAEAHFYHAMSLYHTGKADESITELRHFLRVYPTSPRAPEAQLQIAEAYFNTNRFDQASAEYQTVYRRYPDNDNAALAMHNEGWCHYQAGNAAAMVETFRRLAIEHPRSGVAADAAFSIGDYYYNNKVYDSALVAYQEFVDRFPENERAAEAQVLIHDLGQVEAYREYEVAMEFFDSKNWRLAIQELTKVMEKYPGTDVIYGCKANVASSHAQLGDRKQALQMFSEIIGDWKEIEAARPAVFFAELHKRWIESGR